MSQTHSDDLKSDKCFLLTSFGHSGCQFLKSDWIFISFIFSNLGLTEGVEGVEAVVGQISWVTRGVEPLRPGEKLKFSIMHDFYLKKVRHQLKTFKHCSPVQLLAVVHVKEDGTIFSITRVVRLPLRPRRVPEKKCLTNEISRKTYLGSNLCTWDKYLTNDIIKKNYLGSKPASAQIHLPSSSASVSPIQ